MEWPLLRGNMLSFCLLDAKSQTFLRQMRLSHVEAVYSAVWKSGFEFFQFFTKNFLNFTKPVSVERFWFNAGELNGNWKMREYFCTYRFQYGSTEPDIRQILSFFVFLIRIFWKCPMSLCPIAGLCGCVKTCQIYEIHKTFLRWNFKFFLFIKVKILIWVFAVFGWGFFEIKSFTLFVPI